jgi:Fe-S-cluster containining protein
MAVGKEGGVNQRQGVATTVPMSDGLENRPVPCGGCRLCCQGDAVFLHPDKGDDPRMYRTVVARHPLTGELGFMLAHKPDGTCIYLGAEGCTIHGRAPVSCRIFDCRLMYLRTDRPTRRRMVREGLLSADILVRGRELLATLPAEERARYERR